jgi:hypothetical protein
MPRLDKVGGVDAVYRLDQQIANYARLHPDIPHPYAEQVSMVLRALADHTLLMQALEFDRSESRWPEATSVGRFLHALADRFDDAKPTELV